MSATTLWPSEFQANAGEDSKARTNRARCMGFLQGSAPSLPGRAPASYNRRRIMLQINAHATAVTVIVAIVPAVARDVPVFHVFWPPKTAAELLCLSLSPCRRRWRSILVESRYPDPRAEHSSPWPGSSRWFTSGGASLGICVSGDNQLLRSRANDWAPRRRRLGSGNSEARYCGRGRRSQLTLPS